VALLLLLPVAEAEAEREEEREGLLALVLVLEEPLAEVLDGRKEEVEEEGAPFTA
jgi:hypothetical protein